MTQANTQEGEQPASRRLLAGLVAAALAVYWIGNSRTVLWDRDEPRFAEAAREMLATGDFIVPRFHGELRYDKPILGYYFFAAGMKLFGVNEFGARFFSGVFGALSVIVLYRLARRMTGSERTALAAAAMLATAPVMFVESKLCTVDAGLLFWLLLAFTGFWRIYEGPCGRPYKALFWAGLALAVVTKGPVALAAVLVPLVLTAVLSRDRSFLTRMGWLWGVPLFAALTAPWALAVQARTEGAFLPTSIGIHVVERARRAINDFRGFPGYYLVTLFATFFPWAFFVPAALVDSFKGFRDRPREIFLVSWAAGLIIVLELVETKMFHYSLPVFPALCVLVALFLERSREGNRRRVLAGSVGAFAMALCLGAGLPVALYLAGITGAAVPFAGAGVILVGGMARVFSPRSREGVVAAFSTTMLAWLFVVAAWGMPVVGSYGATLPTVDLAVEAARGANIRAKVAALGYEEPSLVFYLAGDVEFLDGPDALETSVENFPRALVVSRRELNLMERFPQRIVVQYGTAEGINFGKRLRREQIDVFLDWGE